MFQKLFRDKQELVAHGVGLMVLPWLILFHVVLKDKRNIEKMFIRQVSTLFKFSITNLPLCSWLSFKESTCKAGDSGDAGLIPGSGRSPGRRHGNPLQYSWRIPWTEEPDSLQSIEPRRARKDSSNWAHVQLNYK